MSSEFPGLSKSFYGDMESLIPAELVSVGVAGDPTVFNRLAIASASSLSISLSYVGTAFVFNGPADPGASPVQLGFRRGDKLRLTGAAGTEPNHGKEITLADPTLITVLETLVFPDANEYDYVVLRRNL